MKTKSIIGIALIVLSITGMYFWETRAREAFLFEEVLAASEDIYAGEMIDAEKIKIISVTNESLLADALRQADMDLICGRICLQDIRANSQLVMSYFSDENNDNNSYSFTVPIASEWIFSKNAELRAGDVISIYLLPGKKYMGSFPVKLTDPDRDSFVEIQCSLEEYFAIFDAVRAFEKNGDTGMDGKGCLLLVSGRSL